MHHKHLSKAGIKRVGILLVCALVSGWLFSAGASLGARAATPPPSGPLPPGWLDLPLRFVANAGQADSAALFTVHGAGHTLFFTR